MLFLLRLSGGRVEVGDAGVEGCSHQGGRTGAQYAHPDHRDPNAGLAQGAVGERALFPVKTRSRLRCCAAEDAGHAPRPKTV